MSKRKRITVHFTEKEELLYPEDVKAINTKEARAGRVTVAIAPNFRPFMLYISSKENTTFKLQLEKAWKKYYLKKYPNFKL